MRKISHKTEKVFVNYGSLFWGPLFVRTQCRCCLCRRSGIYLRNYYGSGSGPILLDDLDCAGNEMSLADCIHRGWRVHDCDHGDDVSVVCGNGACLSLLYTMHIRASRVDVCHIQVVRQHSAKRRLSMQLLNFDI